MRIPLPSDCKNHERIQIFHLSHENGELRRPQIIDLRRRQENFWTQMSYDSTSLWEVL